MSILTKSNQKYATNKEYQNFGTYKKMGKILSQQCFIFHFRTNLTTLTNARTLMYANQYSKKLF